MYDDEDDLNRRLIKIMNHKHLEVTAHGNKVANRGNETTKEIYCSKITQSYINVRCNISKKCRFAMWYKYDRGPGDKGPVNIKYFRTINNNHDLVYHKEANLY